MISYNLSIKIDPKIENDWIQWVKQEYLPAIVQTGLFKDQKFHRLLYQDERDGITFIIQLSADSIENYKNYLKKFSSTFQKKMSERWKHQFVSFHTVMEIVN